MNNFAEALIGWQLFYATIAAVSATLTGLLFVAISINIDRLKGSDGSRYTRISRRAFVDFLYVLMIGLVFLVPKQTAPGFALAILVLSVSRAVSILRQAWAERGSAPRKQGMREVIREYGLPVVAALGLMLVALEVLAGQFDALYLLVVVLAALLITASWNAWLLLVQESEA